MKKVYVFAIIMALIAAVAVYYFADSMKKANEPQVIETDFVVVAQSDIPANTMITADMVTLSELPLEAINPNAVKLLDEAVGRLTKYPVLAAEQVLYNKISTQGDDADKMSYTLAEGQRAISITVEDFAGVAGNITPGDFVDVVATVSVELPLKEGEEDEEPDLKAMSMLIAENMLVLSTGMKQQEAADSVSTYSIVTLSGTPDQILALYYAVTNGYSATSQKLGLVLRPILDSGLSKNKVYYPELP